MLELTLGAGKVSSGAIGTKLQVCNNAMTWLEMNRVGSPFGAWAILAVEFLWHFKDELRLIWKAPYSTVKAIYLVSRYLPLVFQLVNILLVILVLRSPPVPSRVCRVWLIFQYSMVLIVGALLQGVLLLRLCALYLHILNVRITSLLMFIAQRIISIAVFIYFTLFQATFDSKCSCQVSVSNILDSISFLILQTIIWFLTWRGTRSFAQQSITIRYIPLLHTLLFDGSAAWAAIFLSFAIVIPYITILRVDIHVVFAWPIAIMSVMTCRLVLNILSIEPQSTNGPPEINTQISEGRIWDEMTTVHASPITTQNYTGQGTTTVT